MYGRKIYADQQLIINQQVISGVTSFNGNFELPFNSIDVLGNNFITSIDGEVSKTISFSRFLNQSDHLKYLTGEAFCSGYVLYDNNSFGFSSGFLTSYSVECGVGDIASVSTDLVVYGNIGGNLKHSIIPSQNTDNIYVANFGSIFVNTNEGQTNRITSFEYNVNCERVPLFVLGSSYPSQIILKKPITIEVNLTLEIDDFESDDVQSLLCSPNIQNINIDLKNCDYSQTIDTFIAPNARLVSTTFNGDTESASTITMTFRSFLM
jgi:hypothetical protein